MEQIESLYSKTNIAVFGTIIAGALFSYVFFDRFYSGYLYEWYIVLLIISFIRFIFYLSYKKKKGTSKIKRWGNAYIYLSMTMSLVWGIGVLLATNTPDPLSLAIVGMFVLAVSATPFSAYIIHLKALISFFLPLVMITMFNYFYIGGLYGVSFGLVFIVYTLVMLRSAIPVNSNMKNAIISKYQLEDEIQERKKIEDKLLELSIVDSLTGLYNRRFFDEKVYAELHSAQRTSLSTALILIDIDNFKLYNDNYGHVEGDICLHNVSQAIKKTLKREEDLAFRYGGEEMAVLLPNTNLDAAIMIATKIHRNILNLSLEHLYSDVKGIDVVSVSIGVSCLTPNKNTVYTTLVKDADVALYQAKRNGRNQVVPSFTKASSCAHSAHNTV